MKRELIQKNLTAAVAARAVEGDGLAEARVEAITDVTRRHWLQLVGLIKRGPKAATPAAVNAVLEGLTTAVTAAMEPVFVEAAGRSFDTAFNVWVDYLPREWWRLAFREDAPLAFLEADLEFGYGSPGDRRAASRSFKGSKPTPPPKQSKEYKLPVGRSKGKFPAGKPKPLKKKDKVKPATAARIKTAVKPKPSDTLKMVRSRGWKSRMKKWSDKLTNKDAVAQAIADGFEKGLKFETIVKRVKPHVQDFTSSARRIVRTELARIENQMMEETFKAFAGIIEGYQIINPLDERTRPLHGIRAGKIFWAKKGMKPHASERPELPDAPNCRCCYAPILTAPVPDELKNGPRPDSRSYAEWFNRQPDKVKAKVVGKKRWMAVKDHTDRPSLYDFTDKKNGRFLSPATLKKPRPAGARAAAKAAKAADLAAAKKSLKYWPAKS